MSAAVAAAAAAVPAARKRPAPDQEARAAAAEASKRPRHSGFRSIDDFELFEVLGEGAEGVVRRGLDRRTGKKVALKWIRGDGPDGHGHPGHRALAMEAGSLYACRGHPSIVGISDVAADLKTGDIHLVLELVHSGASLRESMWRPLPEDRVREMMRQLVGAAKKIHEVGFIHRDLKPENVLVCPLGELKFCDFGSATRQKPAGKAHETYLVGTLPYNAPEMLERHGNYGTAVDMWSLGCVMVELLSGGDTLFAAETTKEMLDQMSEIRDQMASAAGKLEPEFLEGLSEDGRDMLTGLLAFSPEQRLTAAQALEHPWFKNTLGSRTSSHHEEKLS